MFRVVTASILVVTLVAAVGYWVHVRRTHELSHPSDPEPVVTLDIAKQKTIWDAEHVAFELETRFGKPFIEALTARDGDALAAFFHDECDTDIGSDVSLATIAVGPVGESKRERRESENGAGAAEFVQSLVEIFSEFDTFDRRRLRALKVRSVPGTAGRWKTQLLLVVRGANQRGELIQHESTHLVEFQLASEDKIPTVGIVAAWRMCDETIRRSPQILMEEATTAYGLDRLSLPDNWMLAPKEVNICNFQMAVEDFDRDGFLDIAIARDGFPILLRSHQGQQFQDVTAPMGLLPWFGVSTLVGWIDYDNDGFPDLLMGDRLYRNDRGKQFVNVTGDAGLRISHDPVGCVVADYDCDGWVDLYVLYQHAGPALDGPWVGDTHSGALNALWRNQAGERFEDVTLDADASGGFRFTFAASWLFLDEDRFPDLYVANDFGGNVLLRNSGNGSFTNVTSDEKVGDFATSMGVASGDLDNDGRPEIYVANMYSKMGRRIIDQVSERDYPDGIYDQIRGSCAGNRLYWRRQGEPMMQEVSEQLGVNDVGWAFAPAFADFNNDGWLDLYATTGYASFDRRKPDG